MQAFRIASLLLAAALPLQAHAAVTGPDKFIPTFLVYYGGGPAFVAGDAAKLAKYDLIDIDRWRYSALAPNTWAAVKAVNPAVEIYLYQMGPETPSHLDATSQLFLNGVGRHNVTRGHSMGNLNGNNADLFLVNTSGSRVYSLAYSNPGAGQYWYLMDFGSPAYQAYWVEAVRADIADQAWRADGVFSDNCLTLAAAGGYSAPSTKYAAPAAWTSAMNSFAGAAAEGLRGFGQKLWCNRGETRSAEGSSAWLALDASGSAPEVVLDEGAFAVEWGSSAVQFYPENEWKRSVDTIGAIANSKVALMSHTKLADGQSGTDNWGRSVTFGDALWYALGSFLLAKNDALNNAYFYFSSGTGYNRMVWFDEYDRIDLGRALGAYRVTTIGGVNVYSRQFERGSVYVNPTANDVASLTLPAAGRLLTRATLGAIVESLPLVSTVTLGGHRTAIVLADAILPPPPAPDTAAPSVPTGLMATAVSANQVSLAWGTSTDNVGVTGYYVYLNDAPLATTTGTTFTHAGLAAGTTYRYRVSAYDAVPNHSAWTAPLTVTTLAPFVDTQAPSVPTGLVVTSVSSNAITLRWSASTDNVGVTGYYVYLNGVPLATTTATTFTHSGLAAGMTYRYRVSAYDAVPNHSSWTSSLTVKTRR